MKNMVGSFILTQDSSPSPLTCSASPFLSLLLDMTASPPLPPLASLVVPHKVTLRPLLSHSPLSLGEPLILSIYLGFAMNIFVVVSLNLQVLLIFFPLNLFCNSRVSV